METVTFIHEEVIPSHKLGNKETIINYIDKRLATIKNAISKPQYRIISIDNFDLMYIYISKATLQNIAKLTIEASVIKPTIGSVFKAKVVKCFGAIIIFSIEDCIDCVASCSLNVNIGDEMNVIIKAIINMEGKLQCCVDVEK